MLNVILALAKVFALVDAGAYLLALTERKDNRTSDCHPCDNCKHLLRIVEEGNHRTWVCGRSVNGFTHTDHDNSLKYCTHFRARDAPESNEGTKEVSES